jgi:lipooligosaccharide transport system permease protein
MIAHAYVLPRLSWRFVPVWRRNFLVWTKLAVPSVLFNLADPTIYMLGLGYGLGSFLPAVGGVPYIAFLAAGTICFSTMNTATFETLYSAFSRMHVQRTWDAITNAPIALDDVVLAELAWAASKSVLSGLAILVVVYALGIVTSPLAVATLAVVPLIGLCFGALGLAITALSPSYDFFSYYFTLVITPMAMLSGVFFPIDRLPQPLQIAAECLPLSHATELVRPLTFGALPDNALLHVAVLVLYAAVGFYAAIVLFRRRLAR